MAKRNRSVLLGFDFPYGYPSGFAAALGLNERPPWRAVWREIAGRVVDGADNGNNRFAAAATFNLRISKDRGPFWGCPSGCECPTLSSTKGRPSALAEKRLTDIGNMQPVWKLYGNGSVGSQALLGVPYVAALRDDPTLNSISRVWPFETGLCRPPSRANRDWLILHAEIYPSLLPIRPAADEVKDALQVRMLAEHFAACDETEPFPNCSWGVLH